MKKQDVKRSLLNQLEKRGTVDDYLKDVVNDYMSLWDVKDALFLDIKKRGVTYQDTNSAGLLMYKNNPSTKEVIAVNKQMMSILKDLSLTVPQEKDVGADELGNDLL